jgi:hypothetical protein
VQLALIKIEASSFLWRSHYANLHPAYANLHPASKICCTRKSAAQDLDKTRQHLCLI